MCQGADLSPLHIRIMINTGPKPWINLSHTLIYLNLVIFIDIFFHCYDLSRASGGPRSIWKAVVFFSPLMAKPTLNLVNTRIKISHTQIHLNLVFLFTFFPAVMTNLERGSMLNLDGICQFCLFFTPNGKANIKSGSIHLFSHLSFCAVQTVKLGLVVFITSLFTFTRLQVGAHLFYSFFALLWPLKWGMIVVVVVASCLHVSIQQIL